MTWMKVDIGARSHPKQLEAVKATNGVAGWFWFCGMCYAREHSTDGFLSDAVLSEIAPGVKTWKKLPPVLVAARLWTRVEGGYQIHDFTAWHPTKADRDEKLAEDALRKRLARQAERDRLAALSVERPHDVRADVRGDTSRTSDERPDSRARDRAGAGASLSPLSALDTISNQGDPEGGPGETASAPVIEIGPPAVPRGRPGLVQSPGAWGVRHAGCVIGFCDFVCLRLSLFDEFVARVVAGGALDADARAQVTAWAQDVRRRWVGRIPGDDIFAFWKHEWQATHGSNKPAARPKQGAGLDALLSHLGGPRG